MIEARVFPRHEYYNDYLIQVAQKTFWAALKTRR